MGRSKHDIIHRQAPGGREQQQAISISEASGIQDRQRSKAMGVHLTERLHREELSTQLIELLLWKYLDGPLENTFLIPNQEDVVSGYALLPEDLLAVWTYGADLHVGFGGSKPLGGKST